jgi:hypothetical protein
VRWKGILLKKKSKKQKKPTIFWGEKGLFATLDVK